MFIKNHKKICILLGVLLVVLIIAAYFLVPYIKRHYMTVFVNVAEVTEMEKVDTAGKKILTVYFTRVGNTNFDEDVDAVSSASLMKEDEKLIGNSQLLATMVQNSVGGELYAIQTEKKYPSACSKIWRGTLRGEIPPKQSDRGSDYSNSGWSRQPPVLFRKHQKIQHSYILKQGSRRKLLLFQWN